MQIAFFAILAVAAANPKAKADPQLLVSAPVVASAGIPISATFHGNTDPLVPLAYAYSAYSAPLAYSAPIVAAPAATVLLKK